MQSATKLICYKTVYLWAWFLPTMSCPPPKQCWRKNSVPEWWKEQIKSSVGTEQPKSCFPQATLQVSYNLSQSHRIKAVRKRTPHVALQDFLSDGKYVTSIILLFHWSGRSYIFRCSPLLSIIERRIAYNRVEIHEFCREAGISRGVSYCRLYSEVCFSPHQHSLMIIFLQRHCESCRFSPSVDVWMITSTAWSHTTLCHFHFSAQSSVSPSLFKSQLVPGFNIPFWLEEILVQRP